MSKKLAKPILTLVCAMFAGAFLLAAGTLLVGPAGASEKRFVPTSWIRYCKHPFRAVGAEYMLAQAIPHRSKQRNQWVEAVRTMRSSAVQNLQRYNHTERESAFNKNLNGPTLGSEKERASSYYAHWCVTKSERIGEEREKVSRIQAYVSERDAVRLSAGL